MSKVVRASDRRRDYAALALVLAGALLMIHAHLGMRDLAADRVTLAEGEWRMNRYNTYSSRSTVGGGLIVAGAIVGLWALIRHVRDPEPREIGDPEMPGRQQEL